MLSLSLFPHHISLTEPTSWFFRRLVTNSSDRILRQFNLPTYPTPPTSSSENQSSGESSAAEYDILEQELEPMYRFNDPINKIAWHSMSYSPDGEWLAGGEYSQYLLAFPSLPHSHHAPRPLASHWELMIYDDFFFWMEWNVIDVFDLLIGAADNATHKIYIWDITNEGQFATTLDGGREPLLHLHVCLAISLSLSLSVGGLLC